MRDKTDRATVFCAVLMLGIAFAFSLVASPIRSNLGADGSAEAEDGTVTAADYVQDGLVALWDGVENAGWGVHDDSVSVWYDLVSGIPISYSGAWEENCRRLNGSYQKVSCPAALANLVSSGQLTYEIVCTSRFEDRYGGGLGFNNAVLNIAAYGSGDSQRQMLHFEGLGITAWQVSPTLYGDNPLSTIFASYAIDVTVGVWTRVGFITDGVERWTDAGPRACTPVSTASKEFRICSRKIYAIRVYDRALSTEEMERNHQTDKERFGL